MIGKSTIVIGCMLFTGCLSMKQLAPTIGGATGAGLGGLAGGIPGAVVGGTLGAGSGQLIQELDRNDKAQKTLTALTQGDVQKLIQVGLEDQKTWTQKVLDGFYSLLKWSAIGLAVYLVVPILYTRHKTKITERLFKNDG